MATPLISLQNAGRQYSVGSQVVTVLSGVTLAVRPGEFLAVTGPDIAGKSALLRLLALLDRPTTGSRVFMDRETAALSDLELADLRNLHIALAVRGTATLIPHLTVLENVELPLRYRGLAQPEMDGLAEAALASVNLTYSADHHPSRLSALETQLVTLARGIAADAALILCDDPFARLTPSAQREYAAVLRGLTDSGRSLVCAANDDTLLALADRSVRLVSGGLVAGGEAACS